MKFYGIESVNPIEIGTPSNDNSLTNLLAWDPNDGQIKYRDSSSISGGGSSSQTLSQVLNTGNDAGTYSIRFRGTQSEIYTITAGTSFSGFGAGMESILAITSSAFAFDPIITQNISGLSILNSTIGAIVWDGSASGLSKKAWMRSQNDTNTLNHSICLDVGYVCINSSQPSTTQSSHVSTSPSTTYMFSTDNTSSSSVQVNNSPPSLVLYTTDPNYTQCVQLYPNSVELNGVAGSDGQVVSINNTGQLCWQTISGSGGGGGSFILPSGEVGFGDGTGITSSINFIYDNSRCTLQVSPTSIIDASSDRSSIIGGEQHCICNNSFDATINGGYLNRINTYSCKSSILGGCNNYIQSYSSNTSIIGGVGQCISVSSCDSSVIGGTLNIINYCSKESSIVGGMCNHIYHNDCGSVILGGMTNLTNCDTFNTINSGCQNKIKFSDEVSILGGSNNCIYGYSAVYKNKRSSIIGGMYNNVVSKDFTTQGYSSVISGKNNCICGNIFGNSIIGGTINYITSLYAGSTNYCSVKFNAIIGGCQNMICSSKSATCPSFGSAIIGGSYNTICGSNHTAIVGGSGISVINCANAAISDKFITCFPIGTSCGSPPQLGCTFRVGDVFDCGVAGYLPQIQCYLRIEVGGSYFKIPVI
jgi:hypothetical protein